MVYLKIKLVYIVVQTIRGGKTMRKRLMTRVSICAIALMIPLTGCGVLKQSDSNINPPPDKVTVAKKGDDQSQKVSGEKSKAAKMVDRKLFLIDAHGHVTPQTVKLPSVKTPANQVLEYLVKDGPVSDILPDGFQAVLPAGTTFTLNLDPKDGTLTADFSKDFLNYKAKDEEKMLEAITWTLTQFDSVKRVKLSVNGKALTKMPVAKTPISSEGLTRADGINMTLGNVVDVTGSESVVVYYLSENDNGDTYYVPVTRRIDATKDLLTAKVNALINPPVSDPTLASPFNGSDVELVDAPVIKDGVVTLDFNEHLYTDAKKKVVSDKAINCLALTFIGDENIKKVAVEVKGKTEMTLESGKPLTKPVTKPIVNKTGI
jgi:germination protein M